MKFLIAGFYHESNTFNPILTKKEDFIEVTGKELLDYFPGAVSAFREAGAEVSALHVCRLDVVWSDRGKRVPVLCG